MERDPSINAKERGIFRGWIVAGCCFCMTLTFGIAYSYSDFFIPLANEFGWNHAVDSAVPAASLLVFSFGSLAGGYFVSTVGFRRILYERVRARCGQHQRHDDLPGRHGTGFAR